MEALLIGHEDWVCGISWQPRKIDQETGKSYQPHCLISSSMDKSMMIWRPEKETGIWLNDVRVGEIGGQNTLGFFGAYFDNFSKRIFAHGYNGAFHMWENILVDGGINFIFSKKIVFF